MTRCLEAIEVTHAYEPGATVLHDVSAAVRGGECVSIVGPNGAGKSTLLRILCGFIVPETGKVVLDGKALSAISHRERSRVLAFLPQIVTPAFALTVREVVSLGRYPYLGAFSSLSVHDRDIVDRCLHDTETMELRDRDFPTLSGGERQRVLLASILSQEPQLLLLDEPTSALDLHHQVEIFALLRRLTGEGYGVAVVTHDLNLAARFSDRLILISAEHGLLAEGAPSDVLTEKLLSEAYTAPMRVSNHPITNSPLVTAVGPGERNS